MTIKHDNELGNAKARSEADALSGPQSGQDHVVSREERRSFIHRTLKTLHEHLVTLGLAASALDAGEKAHSDIDVIQLGNANYRLFRDRVDQLKEEIRSSQNEALIASADHALVTIACYAQRIHQNDYRADQNEEATLSFMMISIHTLSEQLVSQLFPRLRELQVQYSETLTLPPDIKHQQPEFVPPIPEKFLKNLQGTELQKIVTLKDAQSLGDRSIRSPLEEFLAAYQSAFNRIAIAAGIGTFATLVYLRPEVQMVVAYAVIITAAAVLARIARHYGGESLGRWRKQVVSRQAAERDSFAPGVMEMPEKRRINLGRVQEEKPHDRSVDATDLSKTGIKKIIGSHGGVLKHCRRSFGERLGVTASYVTSSTDGKVRRFDAFCREVDEQTPESTSMLDTWFPLRAVPDAKLLESRYGEARIEFSTTPGERTFPLPAGHRLAGISLSDRNGAEVIVEGGIKVREGRLGGFSTHIPEGVFRIEYVVERDETAIPPEAILRLWEAMPKHPCFVPEHQQYLADKIRAFANSPEDLARLDYACLIESGLTYTMDPFVIALQERSQSALSETLLGMRMGICDSFAYTVARRMNTLSLPALTITGLVLEPNDHGELVFNLKEGHAQAVLPTETGPLIFDATLHAAIDTIDSTSLGWYERAEALLTINQGTYREAYQMARHLGERLRGEASLEISATGWFGPLYRLWYAGLVPSRPDNSRVNHLPAMISEDVKIDKSERVLARALMIQSFDDGLKRAVKEGLVAGSFHDVYRYLQNRLTVQISEHEQKVLPTELQSLSGYNPIREGIAYTNSALLEDRLTEGAVEESFDWILSNLQSSRRHHSNSQGARQHAQLNIKEAAQYSDEAYLSRMIPRHQVSFSFAITDLILNTLFTRRDMVADVFATFSELNRQEVAQLIERCDPHDLSCGFAALNTFLRAGRGALSEKPDVSIQKLYQIITGLTAGVGHLLEYSDRSFEELRYQYEQLTMARASLLNALPDWGETLSDPLLREDLIHVFPDTTGHPEVPCIGSLLLSPVAGISATTYFEQKVISRFFSNHSDTFDYSDILERAQRLGFPDFSLNPYQDQIENMVLTQARRIPENERCNLPSNDTPISQLVHDLCDIEAGAVLRLATNLKKQGGLSDSIAAKWPGIDEKLVAARCERYFSISQDLKLCGKTLHVAAPIDLRMYPEYLAFLMPADSRAQECLRYVVGCGARSRQPESAVVAALSFPAFAEHVRRSHQPTPLFFEKIVAAPLIRSLESRAQLYHLLLGRSVWEHCSQDGGSSQQKLSLFLKDYDSDALTDDARTERTKTLLSEFPQEFPGLPSLSDRSKIELILLCYLSGADRTTFETLSGRRLPDELEACLKRFGAKSLKEIWPQQIKECDSYSASIDEAWQRSQAWLADHEGLRVIRSPYQQFLHYATGRVLAKGVSGELSDLREYRQGDDLRLVDYKASARLDKTLVRVFEERETRHVNLVYDADLLWESEPLKSGDSYNTALVDLFSHLHLAVLEGTNLDLWICHRGRVSHLPNLGKSRRSSSQCYYETEDFRSELSGILSGYFGLRRFEDTWLEHPVYEQNILADCGGKLLGDRILVCRIHEENRDASLPMLSFLRKKGANISLVRSDISELFPVDDSDLA